MNDDPRHTAPAQRVRNLTRAMARGVFASDRDRRLGRDDLLLAYAQGARYALQWLAHRCDDAILLDCLAAEVDAIDDACRRIVTTEDTINDHAG